MVDRTKAPQYKIIENIKLPQIKHISFDNKIPFHWVPGGLNDVVSLTFSFRGGAWIQPKRLVASTTLKMLKHGTQNKTSAQISQILNFYAVNYKSGTGDHHSRITVVLLKKHLQPILELVQEIFIQPAFADNELKINLANRKQDYLIDLQEVETVARNLFSKAIYGFDHPYGQYALPEDYDNVLRQDLIEFHKRVFCRENLTVIGAGNLEQQDINLINRYLTNLPSGTKTQFADKPINPEKEKNIYQPKEDSMQSAIMIGNRTIDYGNPDFFKLYFVIYALGGYFSSRLMANIREEKGLTYGIWAYIESNLKANHLCIEASVRKENKDIVINEIRNEITRLKTGGLRDEELAIAKNSLLAEIYKLTDGTFALARYISYLYATDKDESYITQLAQAIKSIDNKTVIDIANKYLCFDDYYKVIVG